MTRKIIIIPILLVFILAFVAVPLAFAATSNEPLHENQFNQTQNDNQIINQNNQNTGYWENSTNNSIHQENLSNNISMDHQTILINMNHTNTTFNSSDSTNNSQNLTNVNLTEPPKSVITDENQTNNFPDNNTTHEPLNEKFGELGPNINENHHNIHDEIHKPPLGNGSDEVTDKGYKPPHIIDNDPNKSRKNDEEEDSEFIEYFFKNTVNYQEDDIL